MNRYRTHVGIPTLEVALSERMTVEQIRRLVALTGEKQPARKADLVAVILRHLAGERLRVVWQGLDQLEQAAVAEIVHSGSTEFAADRFRAKYGRAPTWSVPDGPRHRGTASPLGFFIYGSGVMPADLKDRLKAFVPPPAESRIQSLDETPVTYDRPFERWNSRTKQHEVGTEPIALTLHESERVAPRELSSMLRLVDAGKIAVSDRTRRASATALDAIAAILEGGDFYPHVPPRDQWHDENAGPIRAFAWPLLIQAGGLAQLTGRNLQLTRAGRRALAEPAEDTIRTLWTCWLDSTLLDELSRIDCVKGQTGKGRRGLTAVASRRDAAADSLADCPVGDWVSSDEFFRFVRASGDDFAVTRSAWHLYIGELQYGSLGTEGGAGMVEDRYMLCLLLEYAATLGLIDVAILPPAGARRDYRGLWGTDELPFFSRYDGLMYFRVTPLGAYCLGRAADYEPADAEVRPVLRILPTMEIEAIGPALEPGDRLALDAYACRVSDLVWRLDTGKLLTSVEDGRSLAEIREFLATRSGTPIPGTVVRLLEDVAARSAMVHDRGLGRIVECVDPGLAAFIAGDPRTRRHCMRAGERHLVVPASSEAAFRRALREVGFGLSTSGARPAKKCRTTASDETARETVEP